MKHFIILALVVLTHNFSFAQNSINLTGKSFEYKDGNTNDIERYIFLPNKKAKLVMLSEINGKSYEDVCVGQYTLEANKIKITCTCEDKEIYPSPLKETFIFDAKNEILRTTIHYDKNKNPKIFYLKK